MKKIITQSSIVFLLLFLLQACKKIIPMRLSRKKGIYIAGNVRNSNITPAATYWKNGTPFTVASSSDGLDVTSIFVK